MDIKEDKKNVVVKYLESLKKVVTLKLILAILVLSVVGTCLIIISFDKASTSVFYYISQEIGKALFITALISGAIKWYLTSQYILFKKEREDVLRHELSGTLWA